MGNHPLVWTGKSHADLFSSLEVVRNIYVLGMSVADLIENIEWSDYHSKILMILVQNAAPLSVPMKPLAERMQDPDKRRSMLVAFHMAHKRIASRDSFELVKSYCEENESSLDKQRLISFRNSAVYRFARIVRNTASHARGGHIEWPAEFFKKGIVEVKWRNEVLNSSMAGQELGLGAKETHDLMIDLADAAKDLLIP